MQGSLNQGQRGTNCLLQRTNEVTKALYRNIIKQSLRKLL